MTQDMGVRHYVISPSYPLVRKNKEAQACHATALSLSLSSYPLGCVTKQNDTSPRQATNQTPQSLMHVESFQNVIDATLNTDDIRQVLLEG